MTLFVYSDLLLFTKEDEPGLCNVLRNPLYLQSVKLQEGEWLQQHLETFWGFSGCKGFWPAAGEDPAVLLFPGHPCHGCRASITLLSLHQPGSCISWDTSGALKPFPAFLGAFLRLWAAIPRALESCCSSRDWPRLGKGTRGLRFPPWCLEGVQRLAPRVAGQALMTSTLLLCFATSLFSRPRFPPCLHPSPCSPRWEGREEQTLRAGLGTLPSLSTLADTFCVQLRAQRGLPGQE